MHSRRALLVVVEVGSLQRRRVQRASSADSQLTQSLLGNHRRCPAFCASRASKSGTRGGSAQTKRTGAFRSLFFFCDKPGHTKKVCPARQQWLSTQSQPRSTVAAVTDVESSSAAAVHRANESEAAKCLCTVSSVGGLPRVFVETSCSADFRDSLRARSVVDTGATRTMITADMLTRL